MQKYMLLFHESEDMFRDLSPSEIQEIIAKYTVWRRRLEADGRFVEGRKLGAKGKIVRGSSGAIEVTDGPYVEGKEVLGGYFIVRASSFADAVSIAQASPAACNGAVEVREFDLE
ncbi:MAG: YciI family protein [Myxococcota bacterium]